MINYPDFESHSYQVKQELGHNRAGGRVTYLANKTDSELPVVIKDFQFAHSGVTWADYDAALKEIQVMQGLNHPSIPYYLDSFETATGFCLVQEYKQALSLAKPQHWSPAEIKEIALAVLEVLVYLQKQEPPIFHRDIKPENILAQRLSNPSEATTEEKEKGSQPQIKVYLVDFGFARQASQDQALSSVVKGTLGFMPPEQIFNRQLTAASDLYALGATLICLLTGTKSNAIGNLIDEAFHFNFQHLVPHLSWQFVRWLEKMVAPNLKDRFPNAAVALKALKPISVVGSRYGLEFLSRTLRRRASVTLMTLSSISLAASLGITNFNANPNPPLVNKLLNTGECLECNLKRVNLDGAYLAGAELESANLEGVHLGGSKLENANLQNANLQHANLEGANLVGANLYGTYLEGAKLGGANLRLAYLDNAYLSGASLEGANLWGAKLGGADLVGASLKGAYLGGVSLQGAYLQGANLEGANLEGSDLEGVSLQGANLAGANLAGVNLADADLEGAYLEGANLKRAIMPDGSIHE